MSLWATGKVTAVHRVKISAEDYVLTEGQFQNSLSLSSCLKVTLKLQLLLIVRCLSIPYYAGIRQRKRALIVFRD